jgi:hypothetical protein
MGVEVRGKVADIGYMRSGQWARIGFNWLMVRYTDLLF